MQIGNLSLIGKTVDIYLNLLIALAFHEGREKIAAWGGLWTPYREFFMIGANIPKHLLLPSSVLDTLQNYFTPTLLVLKITKLRFYLGNLRGEIRRIMGTGW